jgi:hypothetical protein
MYAIQYCFICRRHSDFTVSENAGIESRTVATVALKAGRFYDTARSHPPTRLDLIHLYITKLTMLFKGVSYTNLCRILEIEFLGVFSIQVMTQPRLTYQQHASFHHKIKRRRLLCTFSHTNSRYSHHFFSP